MTVYSSRLEDDSTGDVLQLQGDGKDPGLWVNSLQVGGADVRAVEVDKPNGHGTIDTTKFLGAAPVTIAVTLAGTDAVTPWEFLAQLQAWALPNRRPWLYVKRIGWDAEWRIRLRGDVQPPPTQSPGPLLTELVTFRAPDGTWEAADESSALINVSSDAGGEGGFTAPFSLPCSLGAGSSGSTQVITVGGTIDAYPVFRIYGPCTGPKIALPAFGRQIVFKPSFSIAAGQYVSIDTTQTPRLVLANDDPAVSRLNQVDFSQSTFFTLPPGMTLLSFIPASSSSGCQLQVTWRSRRT